MKKNHKAKKRLLALMLSLAMIVTYMPTYMFAYAVDEPAVTQEEQASDPADVTDDTLTDEAAADDTSTDGDVIDDTGEGDAVTDGGASDGTAPDEPAGDAADVSGSGDGADDKEDIAKEDGGEAAAASDDEPADRAGDDADKADDESDAEDDADESLPEDFGKAEYVEKDGVAAVVVQGDATDSKSAAADALAEDTELSTNEAKEVAETLFAKGATRDADDDDVSNPPPSEADGTYIEDTFKAEWVTNDTVDNGDPDLLYVKPGDDSVQSVKLRVSYALSGEHNYNPGDITITVPAKIFRNRYTSLNAPAKYGTMVMPYPEDPSTEKNYNWTLEGDHYIIKNTRVLSAATSGFVEFMIAGLTPSMLRDMEESDPFSAYIQVLTHEGNTIARQSNELTAQFDTEAKITKVTKRAYQSPEIVPASEIPEEQRAAFPDEEYFVKVDWYATVSVTANTYFRLDFTDTFTDENNHIGFVLNANNAEGETSSYTKENAYHNYRIWSSDTFFVSTAYPLSQFNENEEYTFTNGIEFTCIQDDPDPVHVDPDNDESDHKLRTKASATAKTVWSYIDPGWPVPHGHFMIVKNGNDGKDSNNYTHFKNYGTRNFSDLHRWGKSPSDDGWYGIYPFALNEIQDDYAENQETGGDNGLLLSYTIDTIGYVMPWMFDTDTFNGPDGNKASRNSTNYTRPVSITSLETGLCYERDGERLEVGTDYDFVSLEFPEASWIYKALPSRIKADGSFNAVTWDDGTFIYTRDNDASHQPDIDVEVQINGEWVHCATVSWKSGSFSADIERGSLGTGNVINLPEGTENFRTKVLLQNDPKQVEDNKAIQAAINYDVRVVVKLNPTEELVSTVNGKFENTTNPQMFIYNNCELIPERAWLDEDDYDRIIGYRDEDDNVITIKKDGYNTLRGYEIETQAFINKKGSYNAASDFKNGTLTVHYSAEVEDRSYIKDNANYLKAIADGRLQIIRHGYWRDLLPEGMTPDMSSITLGNGSIEDAYYIQDYKGSGRTLLVVETSRTQNPKFVTPTGSDIGYYSDMLSIRFNATIDAQSVLDYADEIEDSSHNTKWRFHNVISFESSNPFLGTVTDYIGEPDDPSVNNHKDTSKAFANAKEKGWMTNLNGRDDPSFLYAGVYTDVDFPQGVVNGYAKEVQTNNDGKWSTGLYYDDKEKNARTVYTGGVYSYRLSFVPETDDGVAKDIKMMDSLENYQPVQGNDKIDVDDPDSGYVVPHWKGTFDSVDVRQLKAQGCEPVVYYSTVENLDLEEGVDLNQDPQQYGNMDLNKTSIWVKAENYSGSLSDVKAVAVDASKRTDGTDFELEPGDSISIIINMRAPSLEEANTYIEQKGDWGDSAQAYNNAAMLFRSSNGGSKDSFKKIHNDYTKVGLEPFEISLDKVWSDENNRDGIRPESVNFDLLANEEKVASVQLPKTDDEGHVSWAHTFTGLAYLDENGEQIKYSLKENPVPEGYTVALVKKDYNYRFTNKHTPERVTISGSKLWVGDSDGTRPDKITVRLYKIGTLYATRAVSADTNGDWNYSFTNLYKYERGKEIKWTVREDVTTVPASYISEQDGYDFVNTYHPYGDLVVEKKVKDVTALSKDQEFEFKLRLFTYDEEGEEVNDFGTYNYDLYEGDEKIDDGTIKSGETFTLKGGQKIHIKEIGQDINYEIIENNVQGFVVEPSPGSSGVIQPNATQNAVFTNKYDASGSVEMKATKTLRGKDLKRYNFNYKIYLLLEDGTRRLVRTSGNEDGTSITEPDGTVVSTGAVNLGRISYTESDSYTDKTPYKDFRYQIEENIPEEAEDLGDGRFFLNGYIYDTTIYYATVRVTDNGDGTLDTELKYQDKNGKEIDPLDVVFNNEYHAEGSIELHAWKQLVGRDLENGEFSFKLQDENGNDILDEKGDPIVVTNDQDGVITFPEIWYDEKDDGKSFRYRIVEVKGDDETVQYDESVFGYIVTVEDIGKGRVQATAVKADPNNNWSTENAPLPLFVNPLYPGGLKITKKIVDNTGEADPDQKFTIKVEFPDAELDTIEVDTDSYTGEYTWDKDTQTATFSLAGNESVIINNIPAGTSYRVSELSVAGWSLTGRKNVTGAIETLTIKEAELTNTYTPNDTYFIFNGIKYLDGKGAPETYVDKNGNRYRFSFNLSWYDPSYDRWWSLQTASNTDGGFIQFNPIRYKSRTWYENMSPNREIWFRIVEQTSSAQGIVFDTQTEYVYVKVVNENGKLKATYRYPDDGDEGIVFNNKTKPGELRLKKNAGDLSDYADSTKDQDFTFEVTFKNEDGKPLGEDDKIFYYIEDEDGNIVQNNSKGLLERIKDWFSEAKEDIKESFNEPLIYTAFGADDEEEVLYSGEKYGAPWRINADHELVIGQEGLECTLTNATDDSVSYNWECAWRTCAGFSTIKSIRFEGTVHAVGSMAYAFSYLGGLSGTSLPTVEEIDFTNLDTSGVTNMSHMFIRSRAIKKMNVNLLDTSNVTNMSYMFQECAFDTLDFTGWNTSKVTTMYQMFISNQNLKSLDLSSFDTSSVVSFMSMFSGCSNLEYLNVSSFSNESALTGNGQMDGLEYMFSGCTSLKELDLGNFVMKPKEHVAGMFQNTTSLQRVNLGQGFLFRKGLGWGSTWNKLMDPPEPYDGWCREDGSSFNGKQVFTADELWQAYDNAYNSSTQSNPMAGWWIWHVPDTQGIVRFDANGGYIEPDAAMFVVDFYEGDGTAETPTEPLVRKPGFEIDSWNTEPDGSGDSYPAGATGVEGIVEAGEEVTLYAQWTKSDKVRYLVKHYLQNNESVWSPTYELADTVTITVDGPGEYVAPTKEYSGYVTPWQQTVNIKEDFDTVIEYRYKRLHYTVVFDGNGATEGSMQNVDMYGNIPATLSANKFSREHAVFTGWNTKADGSGDAYSDMETVSNLTETDGATVTLYAQWFVIEDTVTPATEGTVIVTCKAGQTIVFPDLPAGTTYTIRELDTTEGWYYAGTVDDGKGVIKADTTSEATVNNRYTASVEVPLEALKVMEGRELNEGDFTFELWNESTWNAYVNSQGGGSSGKEKIDDGSANKKEAIGKIDTDIKPGGGTVKPINKYQPIQTKTNGDVSTDDPDRAAVYFDPLTFVTGLKEDLVGESRTYVIREVAGNEDGVTYDDHIEYVTITFEDAGHGLLSADVEYWHYDPETGDKVVDTDGAVFNNKYTPPHGSLTIVKQIVGDMDDELRETEFDFSLELIGPDGQPLEGEYYGAICIDGKEDKYTYTPGAGITLGNKDYVTIDGLPAGTTYTVNEGDKTGWMILESENVTGTIISEENAEVVFKNTYVPTIQIIPPVTKKLKGGELEEGDFKFGLYNADGDEVLLEEAYNDADGNVSFQSLVYGLEDVDKTYVYVVREITGERTDVIYDTSEYHFSVEITQNDDGSLKATTDGSYDDIEFVNTELQPAEAELKATKEFNNWTDADSFTFRLTPKDGAPMPLDEDGIAFASVEADATQAAPEVTFGTISFDTSGTYEYEIVEKIPDDAENADGVTWAETTDEQKAAGGFRKDDVTYDSTVHTVTVTVTGPDKAGKHKATVTYDGEEADAAVLVNEYSTLSELELTKVLDGYVDAGTDSNVTMAFKVVGYDADGSEVYSTHVGMTFSKDDVDPDTGTYRKTAKLKDLPRAARYEVTEVYSGNYTPDAAVKQAEYNEKARLWTVSFDNSHSGYTPGSGAVNKYEKGKIVKQEGLTGGDGPGGGEGN